jgi:hypothetical protein
MPLLPSLSPPSITLPLCCSPPPLVPSLSPVYATTTAKQQTVTTTGIIFTSMAEYQAIIFFLFQEFSRQRNIQPRNSRPNYEKKKKKGKTTRKTYPFGSGRQLSGFLSISTALTNSDGLCSSDLRRKRERDGVLSQISGGKGILEKGVGGKNVNLMFR